MDAVADLLEMSVGQLWTIIAVGCVIILIVVAALAAVFVLM
jgi:hypothetical protein